ncbi:hypothetical protein A6A03_07330 [Chloroflexus islandicus]|uniref:Glycosyltransferase RgtA/B/C/D-like domain-containing protein n=1 Tax=Chloroflexus islandicus TaxID=1707952 RepID=A0A178MJ01_9CHLR|nr:hypothetical protein [Chloroflexus islandicus]OAN48579.1 hypothetical protein A6A03_07330 [Chloroflexus islandicus]
MSTLPLDHLLDTGKRQMSLLPWHWFWGGLLSGLVLYLPFGSIQHDLNGVAEAMAIARGGNDIFRPNHMLYGIIGRFAYTTAQTLGYAGPVDPILKFITALAGATTIGLASLALRRLSATPSGALLGIALLALSWAQWSFSTDIYYIPLAAAFSAGAFASSLYPPRIATSLLTGLCCALAILTWQACVFLVPMIAISPLVNHRQQPFRDRLSAVAAIAGACGLILSLCYLSVAFFVYGYRDLTEIMSWLANYGGARLPVWGTWSPDRIVPAGISAIASIIPLWSGIGLRRLLSGSLPIDKIPALLSLLALLGGAGMSIWLAVRRHHLPYRQLVWLGATYALFVPFIIWWDPYEPKWFVVPNLFLAAAIAVVWGSPALPRPTTILAGVCVLLIGWGNFQAAIWPRATVPNPNLETAACVAQHLRTGDLLIETDWSFGGYLNYFYGCDTVSLIDLSARVNDDSALVAAIADVIRERQTRGGRVFIEDLDSYGPAQQAWFFTHTGVAHTALHSFPQQPAFVCANRRFEQLTLSASR